ncbi:MAG TPA: signal peptidase I [Burkholderiaceae bacterium]|nr:signal peptidase I [Burkholderiaceae bacterium]
MNFALILLVLTTLTGIIWFIDYFYLRKQRLAHAKVAMAAFDQQTQRSPDSGAARSSLYERLTKRPAWVEYTGGFFPVIAAVFFLRSFVVEPFRIPSGSMIPTLVVGDLILVNKFVYGIRLPVVNTKVVDVSLPKRGDVMVFRYPKDETLDYIKRVVGLPGDEVVYENKRLTINGKPVATQRMDDYFDADRLAYADQYVEKFSEGDHRVLIEDGRAMEIVPESYPFREACTYNSRGVRCKVPPGHYFMMGDNRDNSLDSRFWGFVPEKNIVGKAFFVWMNFSDLSRIGRFH